ncbi:hypothetical protein RND81_10G006900 [Saponaria officinalis]|uniref:Uncharacterized protein n=1 Tax=Saponaria officinalis TaxID=3572 RepID=A0AAW1HX46_SAPOF
MRVNYWEIKPPYKKFLEVTKSLEGYWFDEEKLTILPDTEPKPPQIELAECECVALTYFPGTFVTKSGKLNPPFVDNELLLHVLFEANSKTRNALQVNTQGFTLEAGLLVKLQQYAPLVDSSGTLKRAPGQTLKHARTELVKHLNHIPFLNGMEFVTGSSPLRPTRNLNLQI